MCFSKEEIKQIYDDVEVMQEQSDKFEIVEETLPPFLKQHAQLKEQFDELYSDNLKMYELLEKLFKAEKENNTMERYRLFKEAGFEVEKLR